MTRVVRRVAIAVLSPALVVALVQAPSDVRPTSTPGRLHSASPTKVCILNPVWGDAPCLS